MFVTARMAFLAHLLNFIFNVFITTNCSQKKLATQVEVFVRLCLLLVSRAYLTIAAMQLNKVLRSM